MNEQQRTKKILLERKSGQMEIVHIWPEPKNGYLSNWSAGQTCWMTPEQAERTAKNDPTHLAKLPDGSLDMVLTFSAYVDPSGMGVSKMGYTCCVEGLDVFKDMGHVRWFFNTLTGDPIVAEVHEDDVK